MILILAFRVFDLLRFGFIVGRFEAGGWVCSFMVMWVWAGVWMIDWWWLRVWLLEGLLCLVVYGFDYLVVFVGWWRCVYHVMILTL